MKTEIQNAKPKFKQQKRGSSMIWVEESVDDKFNKDEILIPFLHKYIIWLCIIIRQEIFFFTFQNICQNNQNTNIKGKIWQNILKKYLFWVFFGYKNQTLLSQVKQIMWKIWLLISQSMSCVKSKVVLLLNSTYCYKELGERSTTSRFFGGWKCWQKGRS